MSVRLYLDDDSGLLALISQARQEGLTVVRSDDVGMRGASDAEHLRYAAANGLVLVTCNWRDFMRLHHEWTARGELHRGIFLVNQWIPPGERIRLFLHIAREASPDEFVGKAEWLKDWLAL